MTPGQTSLFDYAAGVAMRDRGIEQVEANDFDWMAAAQALIARIPIGWEGLGEDIRARVIAQIGEPHHSNCWGALIMGATRRGMLVKTGTWQNAKSKRSHASMYPVLRRVNV